MFFCQVTQTHHPATGLHDITMPNSTFMAACHPGHESSATVQAVKAKRKRKKCKKASPEKNVDHGVHSSLNRRTIVKEKKKLLSETLPRKDCSNKKKSLPDSKAVLHTNGGDRTNKPTEPVTTSNESIHAVPQTTKFILEPIVRTTTMYPSRESQISSNWKSLLQVVTTTPKTKAQTNTPTTVMNGAARQKTKLLVEMTSHHTKQTEVWFDDVDKDLLDVPANSGADADRQSTDSLVKTGAYKGLTKAVAMDCEMVGVGQDGTDSIVARVSIVNKFGSCIYDKYVKPTEHVTDYRTPVSGIRPSDIAKGEEFSVVQKEVSDILNRRILVGHAINHDLKVLFLGHPRHMIRDTALYKEFRKVTAGRTPSLKKLSLKLLGVKVQEGEHSSVQDAQAAMRLYTMFRKKWENTVRRKREKHQRHIETKEAEG